MTLKNVVAYIANLLAVVNLILIIALPFFLANRMVKVAGIKTAIPYLISSQIQRFPNLTFSQEGQTYSLIYSQFAPSQTYQSVLILTNTAAGTQNFSLVSVSGQGQVFFGEDPKIKVKQIALPSGASTPISLFSDEPDYSQNSKLDFSIDIN